jgi:6-phospho-3-hexuloisomerase
MQSADMRVCSKIEWEVHALSLKQYIEAILEENRLLLQNLGDEALGEFIRSIQTARSIFFCGQGRSGFVLRCFCMRLMHLGYRVYFCGETITPAIGKNDLLVVLSGSGNTASTIAAVEIAKTHGATTCGIVANLDSKIASLLNQEIHLPGTTKMRLHGEPHSIQMAGSLFEQASFIFLEAVILALYLRNDDQVESFSNLHAVIE